MDSCVVVAVGLLSSCSGLSGEVQSACTGVADTVQLATRPDGVALLRTFALDGGVQLLAMEEGLSLTPVQLARDLTDLYGSALREIVIASADWPSGSCVEVGPILAAGIAFEIEWLNSDPPAVLLHPRSTEGQHNPPLGPPGSVGG